MPTRFATEEQAVTYIFESLARTPWRTRGLDEDTRDLRPTQQLLAALGLPAKPIEFALVTGSKGKGSTAYLTSKVLQALGHRVGLVTSPHLLSYRERFRVDGRAMPPDVFLTRMHDLAPTIDAVVAGLPPGRYLSPQGIFLALALAWFADAGVSSAVIEVGRGGRFDDNALAPNMLSLFTPIFLEHTRYLGPTLERIAWHKAGIIKPLSYAVSLPQARAVLDVLLAEADARDATFTWLAPQDLAQVNARTPDRAGWQITLGRYGTFRLGLLGLYEAENATLAVQAAGNMHGRLHGAAAHTPHFTDPAYTAAVHHALATAHWPGRAHKLQDTPPVYVDAATNPSAVRTLLASLDGLLPRPIVAVAATPSDRDAAGVYAALGAACDHLLLTQSARNITIAFPAQDEALRLAPPGARWLPDVPQAVDEALRLAGGHGSVVLALTLPAVADALALWRVSLEQV